MSSNLYNPVPILTVILAFGIAPFVALMVTSYTKLVIVFGLLRAALGMSMIAPTTLSVPFKLLLFVMLQGWTQLIQGLVLSYR